MVAPTLRVGGEITVDILKQVMAQMAVEKRQIVVGTYEDIANYTSAARQVLNYGPISVSGLRSALAGSGTTILDQAIQDLGGEVWGGRSPVVIKLTPTLLYSLIKAEQGLQFAEAFHAILEGGPRV